MAESVFSRHVPEALKRSQLEFAGHIRSPQDRPVPANIEPRRMAIYRELFYRNIEGFIVSAFPILRSLYRDTDWHAMVRDFMVNHRCQTPYFLELSQEFLGYLQTERESADDPGFILELAHYEWVELALDVSELEVPADTGALPDGNWLSCKAVVSPLAWPLSYRYPVHRIGPDYQPETPPEQPTCLVVYRNRRDEVRFLEANAATLRLLELLIERMVIKDALEVLAQELGRSCDAGFLSFAQTLLVQLYCLNIITGFD